MLQDINEISDGKVYGVHDMVRVGCSDCEGNYMTAEQAKAYGLIDAVVEKRQ